MSDPSFEILYNKTLRFLSFRPRSEKEVRDYLLQKLRKPATTEAQNAEEARKILFEKIITRLREYKFLDDLEFARWWIENRKKGGRLISLELRQKGIAKEIIETALSEFDMAKKESDLLEKLIQKKLKTLSKDPKGFNKMLAFLARKGFDFESSKKAIGNRLRRKFDD